MRAQPHLPGLSTISILALSCLSEGPRRWGSATKDMRAGVWSAPSPHRTRTAGDWDQDMRAEWNIIGNFGRNRASRLEIFKPRPRAGQLRRPNLRDPSLQPAIRFGRDHGTR